MAERHEIAEEIDALAVHCRPPLMSVEDRARWLADWCRDLADFPIEAINHACTRWRKGQDRKFPMLGQLLPLIRSVNLEGRGGGRENEPWRPISDAEYAQLSIREKLRHHQILGHAATREAGPMWENGQPKHFADMPEDWHGLQRRAQNHNAEVKRLREIIARPENREAEARR